MSVTETKEDTTPAEEGAISVLFGGPARTRIIEAFVANESRELNVSDISRLSDTARSSVYRHIEELEEIGIIEHFEDTGRYTLASDDELAQLLRKVEGITLKRLLKIEQSDN